MKLRLIAAALCLCAMLALVPGVCAAENESNDVPAPQDDIVSTAEEQYQKQLEEYLAMEERVRQLENEQKILSQKICLYSITSLASLLGLILVLVSKRKFEKIKK